MPASLTQRAAGMVGLLALFAGGCNLHHLNQKVGRGLSEIVVSLGQRPGTPASEQHPVRDCSTLSRAAGSPSSDTRFIP